MTINSGWMKIWKAAAGGAFQATAPFVPDVAFIDGQIKLMKPTSVKTWQLFLVCQFVNCVRRHFEAGVSTVVLAFDNYEHVPVCKGMTQHKRNKKVNSFSFASGECLPPIIPDNWEDAIRNRLFKSRVIDYVKTNLHKHLTLAAHQRLIIDHNSTPVVHLPNGTCQDFELPHAGLKGESDVKFTSYTHLGNLLIDAIDGDYVPMAMVHLENLARAGTPEASLPQIAIYRMRVRAGAAAPASASEPKYEYVHINRMAQELCDDVARHCPGCRNACTVLASFAILTGCDYTQGLPTIGPTRVWCNRERVIPLLSTLRGGQEAHDRDVATLSLACPVLYAAVYERRVSVRVNQSAYAGLGVGEMEDRAYLRSNARNSLWTLHYWNAETDHPDPYSNTFGYKRARGAAREPVIPFFPYRIKDRGAQVRAKGSRMVVVNKKSFYPNTIQYAPQPLGNHYVPADQQKAVDYVQSYSLISYKNTAKIANSVIAVILFFLTFGACCVTITRSYGQSKIPMNIITYSIDPWDEYQTFGDVLKGFTNATGTKKDNVRTLWAWSKCDQYITTGRVPKSTDKLTLEVVSGNNPVYIPGGCNCIAQVANAMGDGWLYATATAPSKDDVKKMINFCTYEGSMPHNLTAKPKAYRTLFYVYSFLFLSCTCILIANFMHDLVVMMLKSSKASPENLFAAIKWKLIATVVVFLGLTIALMITLLLVNKGAPTDAKNPEIGLTVGIFIMVAAAVVLFVVPYLTYPNVLDAIHGLISHEIDTGILLIDKEIRDRYLASDVLNAQGQIEQLWTDVLAIPAFVSLIIAVCIMRGWTDYDILLYNALLVFLLLLFTAAGNWVTCHWTRVVTFIEAQNKQNQNVPEKRQSSMVLGAISNNLDGFYQGYKNTITLCQLFIIIALCFTATPTSDVTQYSYIAMYNWLVLMVSLFAVFVFPDLWNDFQALKLHNVTATKQAFLNVLIFMTFLTVSYTEYAKKSLVS
ncbi:hypothetical protein GUITHDRAFT_118959 [Guillardia theta CCMP2712]|uniref:Uncharacterized protein n=1 Tax=Guillardia theta (strain CCMP2712) TaxID=905079 RepID=L1IGF7_GUITC|nr:hypothetical protein GUITHDRAFT_118959 [Guillardia theta CCMP2712]EKX34915.1 hypothetical protein GUITHDRAFT_118959 [Guillardia theta CCMP2712]|eukprot:XP_005821895.1 hypothetical protein GUITHDRAFT_118959 [Guillardia theta CCMP2712]